MKLYFNKQSLIRTLTLWASEYRKMVADWYEYINEYNDAFQIAVDKYMEKYDKSTSFLRSYVERPLYNPAKKPWNNELEANDILELAEQCDLIVNHLSDAPTVNNEIEMEFEELSKLACGNPGILWKKYNG